MEKQSIYTSLLIKSSQQEFKMIEESRKWFRKKASEVSKAKLVPTKIIEQRQHVPNIKNFRQIGSLFFYNYAPKTRKELNYYDTFPIVFPFKILKDGFLGLNLHYLPISYRAILMDNLYSLINSADMEEDATRLQKLRYSIIESKRQFYLAYPCIHRYLNKQIRSQIAFIPPKEWELALFLPMQRFQKKAENAIWRESIVSAKQRILK